MNHHFDPTDTAFLNTQNLKRIILIFDFLMDAWKITLDFKQQSGQSIGIAFHFLKFLIINIQNLAEVSQQSLTLKNKCIIIQFGVELIFLIILIFNLTYDFLQNILKSYDTACAAKFIYHDGDMYLILLKFSQQIINLLGLRYKIRRTNQTLPSKRDRFF